jgi:hypothetical protein
MVTVISLFIRGIGMPPDRLLVRTHVESISEEVQSGIRYESIRKSEI